MPDDHGNHYYNTPDDQGTDAYLIAYLIATNGTPRCHRHRRRHRRPSLGADAAAAATATDGPSTGAAAAVRVFRPCAMCPFPPLQRETGHCDIGIPEHPIPTQ